MMKTSEQGFSLVTAIFLLVVLSALLGYMINLSTVQHSTVAMSVRGARAMQAARSALDYAIFRVLPASGCSQVAANVGFTAAEPALQAYSVQLSCSESAHIEGTTTVTVYQLTAIASTGNYSLGSRANPDYVSRSLRATVSANPP